MADPNKIKELAGKLFEIVERRTGGFVDDHADARAFLENRTTRLATLMLDLGAAADDAARDRIRDSISLVQETIDTELLSIANDAVPVAKATFRDTLKALFEFAKEVLPTFLAAVI